MRRCPYCERRYIGNRLTGPGVHLISVVWGILAGGVVTGVAFLLGTGTLRGVTW